MAPLTMPSLRLLVLPVNMPNLVWVALQLLVLTTPIVWNIWLVQRGRHTPQIVL